MRIAFFLPSFPEISETFILRQITGLLDRGHDVRILAHRRPRHDLAHPQVLERSLLKSTRYLAWKDRHAGHDTGRRNRWFELPRPGRFAAALRQAASWEVSGSPRTLANAAFRAGTLAFEPAPDVVHCHYGDVGLQYGFSAHLWGAPLIVSFYGYDCSSYPRRFGSGIYGPLFRHAACVTALSQDMRQGLIAMGAAPQQVAIQPLSVDLHTFQPRDRAIETSVIDSGPFRQGLRVLTVARLVEKKGIEYALRALIPLFADFPGLDYLIVGEGPLGGHLERVIDGTEWGHRVKFLGALPEPEVARAMREADVFLLPSVVAGDGDREGTPTVLLEAAASSLPVVSTVHAGIPEIVRNGLTGLLVAERDSEALSGALRRLLDNPEERKRMGQAGRRQVETDHDITLVTAQLETLYASALAVQASSIEEGP